MVGRIAVATPFDLTCGGKAARIQSSTRKDASATPAAAFMKKKKGGEQEEARCQLLEALEKSREPHRRVRFDAGDCVPLPE